MIARDMGVYGIDKGLYMESKDGKHWSKPEIAYQELSKYIDQPPAPKHLNRYGRVERPQLLFQKEKRPIYLLLHKVENTKRLRALSLKSIKL